MAASLFPVGCHFDILLATDDLFMTRNGGSMTEITTKQLLFVECLANSTSVREAASKAGVSQRTGERWVALPEVKAALHDARQGRVEDVKQTAHEIITKMYSEALEPVTKAVVQIAKDSEAPASARLKAAQMIQDRLAPVQATNEQSQPTTGRYVDLNVWTMQEIERLDALLQEVENRQQAEQGVTPLRKVN
jgi:transposase